MIAFIDDHREAYGVEPICKVLPIAPSTYRAHAAKRADPAKLSARAKQDAIGKSKIRRVFAENFDVYGVRKVWRQLRCEGEDIDRCTVERLMRSMGLQGVIRGKPVKTTIGDKAAPCPLDHVNRRFRAPRPNALWVSDFTYVATWTGFVSVAFVIDAYARRIVGWRASRTAHASFVLDALEQAMTGGPCIATDSCITATGQPIRLDQIHRALGGSGYRAFCRQRRRQLRQCSRRNHQRSLQSRGHPSARTVAVIRGCRVRDAGVGGLVQQSPAAGAHRQHPASRSRGTLLCHDRATRHGGVTQTKQPPANPGRFTVTRSGNSLRDSNVRFDPLEGHSPIVQLIGGNDRRLAVIEPGEGDLGAAVDES